MQRRHFEAIAAIIAILEDPTIRKITAVHFCDELAKTNVGFDAARFIRACRVVS